jgi:predicted Zn-dependent protease
VASAAAQQVEPGKGVNFYSFEKEAALGSQLAQEVRREHKELESTAVQSYIQDLGKRLATQIGGPPFTYTFTVIADTTPYNEAIALPGGFVFVPASLLLAARDEDELAGILTHSIAHIASRDGTRVATRAELVNVASAPIIMMGGSTGYAMRQGNELAVPLKFLEQWRKYEIDADRLAAARLPASGYDPAALARFIEREQPQFEGKAREPKFSRVPPLADRVAAIRAVIGALPVQDYLPHEGLSRIQDEVRRLTASTAPARKAPTLIR